MVKIVQHEWYELADSMLEYNDHEKDCVVAISGEEGDGKSALSRMFAYRQYPKLLGRQINLQECTFYGKKSLQAAMEKTNNSIFIHDEAIDNFNRTFFDKDQINFVKMLKVVRDHKHILYQNIPVFWELDSSIRKRIRFYLYVEKCVNVKKKTEGLVYIFKKRKTGFSPDPWFRKLNEKLELNGQIFKSPNFYGQFKIPWMGETQWFLDMEEEAKKIKDLKKSEVYKDEQEEDSFVPDQKKMDAYTLACVINKLASNGLITGNVREIARAMDYNYNAFSNLLHTHINSKVIIKSPRSKKLVSLSEAEQEIIKKIINDSD